MKGITLTMKEQRMNDIIVKLMSKQINIQQAIRLTSLSERQLYRKLKKYKELGINSIPHALKSNPSKFGYPNNLKNKILTLYKNEYMGWNFHHFNDTLEDQHNIIVSDSFIYNLLTNNNIQSPHKYKHRNKSHPPRERKEYAGELLQVDASKHKWFYGDDNYYHLHGAIDDSTGIVTSCFFQKEETTLGYQLILKQTIINFGIPECLYTDFRTIFKSSKKELTLDEELDGKHIKNTKFANMLEHIGTDIISTINPRAKGRIERLWKTFQDRLYNELKKLNIITIEEANLYLKDIFLPQYNARFALPIDNNKNRFICLDSDFDFNKELAIWSEHKVYHNCYLKYNHKYHIILKDNQKVSLPTSDKVRVYTFLDQTEHILFNDEWYDLLPVTDFKIEPKVIPKTISTIKQDAIKNNNSPWRKGLPPIPSHKTTQWAFFNSC